MNFVKDLFQKRRDQKIEQRVLKRYQELAGALGNSGEMLNRDKESRAREWVKEQERLLTPKENFWNSRTIQAAFIGGAFSIIAVIIGLYLSK